ncbi:MAG: hypothetical protein JO296_16310 [Pseudonocardiales bacterium]|nr:hypothetical protein [Pseudonocardiales bacterium]
MRTTLRSFLGTQTDATGEQLDLVVDTNSTHLPHLSLSVQRQRWGEMIVLE